MIYGTVPDSQESRSLGIPNAQRLAVSSKGELAVALRSSSDENGLLSRRLTSANRGRDIRAFREYLRREQQAEESGRQKSDNC